MIIARSLTRTFDRTVALRDVSLTIETGEMFALIGPDGAGKTTFFRIVTDLLRPTSGELRKEGHQDFGFVPQRFAVSGPVDRREPGASRLAVRARRPGRRAAAARSCSSASASAGSGRGWRATCPAG